MLCDLGDDAAAVRLDPPVLVTTDALVEGVHFRRTWGTPRQLGRKAFAVNASDIAAMGGEPRYAVIDLRAPRTLSVRFLEDVYRGFCQAAERHGARLVGGNTCRASRVSLGVTLLGRARHGVITRAGCRPGDDLYVTGTLGLAALGLRALRVGERRGAAVRRFLEPPSRVALGAALARTGLVGGMIDVSDGLLQDVRHLCEASGVSVEIEEASLPFPPGHRGVSGRRHGIVLRGGEDYELLFSARPALARRLPRLRAAQHCAVTRIGRVVAGRRGVWLVGAGGKGRVARGGFDHYGARQG